MTAVAATREPEARQTKEVWKDPETAKLPRKEGEGRSQTSPPEQLPLGQWMMESIGMSNTQLPTMHQSGRQWTQRQAVSVRRRLYTADQGLLPPNKRWTR